jgi:hypothetical protein
MATRYVVAHQMGAITFVSVGLAVATVLSTSTLTAIADKRHGRDDRKNSSFRVGDGAAEREAP